MLNDYDNQKTKKVTFYLTDEKLKILLEAYWNWLSSYRRKIKNFIRSLLELALQFGGTKTYK